MKASEAVAGISLLVVLMTFAVSVFRDQPYSVRGPLMLATLACVVTYNSVRDGNSGAVWFVAPVFFVASPFAVMAFRNPKGRPEKPTGNTPGS